jgi:uncharacterized membrane protein YagU involved in acid resistance
MSTVATSSAPARAGSRAVVIGVAGGLAGGAVFGAMMVMQGMLPMVASLIGSQDAVIGFVVHMAISAAAGLVYGLAVAALPALVRTPVAAVASGAAYGLIWWVGGALIAMPLLLGMNEMVFAIGEAQLMSLLGHVVFGAVMGLVVTFAARRA